MSTSNSLLLGKTNGVCVNSIITDKIREYMMSDSPSPTAPPELNKENTSVIHEHKKGASAQDAVSTSDLVLPSTLNVSLHNSGDPCPHKQDLVTASIRRIGNSLDALLNESKNASHVKAVKKVVPLSSQQQNADRLFLSSEQICYKKSVTLHDICEEYIQFITVNSPEASPDDERVTTTSGRESPPPDRRQRSPLAHVAEPELQVLRVPVIPTANVRSAPVAAVPKKRIAQISVITVNENLSKNTTAAVRKRSIEDIPVATETECEKSNGAADQTTTECGIALEKKQEESLTTAATTAKVDDILNGIKPTRYAVAEEKNEADKGQELTKIESTASAAAEKEEEEEEEEEAQPTDGINEPERSTTPTALSEQPEAAPLRNGLARENAEENGVSADDADDTVLEKIMDEVSTVVEQQSQAAEQSSAEESVSAPTVEAMEVDEGASVEPMETTNPAEEESAAESKPVENNVDHETANKDDQDSPKEDVESSETAPCAKDVAEDSVELEKKDEPQQSSTDEDSPTVKEPSSTAEITKSAKDTTISSLAAPAPTEQDASDAPSPAGETTQDEEREPVKPTAVPSEPICDSEGTASVRTEEKADKPTDDDKDNKNIVEQAPEVEGEIHIKEEVMSTEGSSFNESSTTDSAEPATATATVSLSESSTKDSAPATVQATGTKRRADTASEDLEADRDGRSSSGSDMETNQDPKRIRFDESIFEEDDRERSIREFVERSIESTDEIGKNCDKLQQEISALSDLAHAKELEWNSIIRLLKLKEEMLERVLFKKRSLDCQSSKNETDSTSTSSSKLYKSITSSTEQTRVNRNELNVPTCIGNQVTVVPISSLSAASAASGGPQSNAAASGQDSVAFKAAAAHLASSLRAQHRPILPKPAPGIVTAGAGASTSAPTTTSVTQSVPSAVATVQPTTHATPLSAQTMPQNLLPANAAAAANSLLIDQNSVIGEGRQGTIVDVKSIIAEYRSKNPESSPRRGRRNIPFTPRIPDAVGGPRFLPNTALLSMANMALGSGAQVRTNVSSTTHSGGDHGRPGNIYLGQDATISAAALNRPDLQIRQANVLDPYMLSINAANSSSSSQSNAGNSSVANMASASTSNAGSSAPGQSCFQDALVKFAKLSEKRDMVASSNALMNAQKNASHLLPPPPYPEVTLHPVLVPQFNNSPQNSLLHGILTKSSSGPSRGGAGGPVSTSASNVNSAMGGVGGDHHPSSSISGMNASASASNLQHRPTTFSPTLARLLTAPDRNRSSRTNASSSASRNTKLVLNEIIHSKKNRTEVTITPVTTNATSAMKNGSDVLMVDDDDESENTDRLVIDEGREAVADPTTNVIPADQVPQCQGCHKKSAQFVCAGCGNQWYCSRECQVDAWEEHSERCTG